jgi:hypothetical protein
MASHGGRCIVDPRAGMSSSAVLTMSATLDTFVSCPLIV